MMLCLRLFWCISVVCEPTSRQPAIRCVPLSSDGVHGNGRNCGTKSQVYVVLGGEAEDSEIRCLLDEQKRVRFLQIYNTGWSILKANIVYI